MKKKLAVIGSGISGLSAASYMAKAGWDVVVIEKNDQPGGRARQLKAQGYTFDMGPSWYWMPDVFDKFYADFGHKSTDFYTLTRLEPSYRIVTKAGDSVDIPSNMGDLQDLFERFEPGSSVKLKQFLKEAKYKYEVGINELVYKPGLSLTEFVDWKLISGVLRMQVFVSMKSHIESNFKHPFLRELLEFPVLFLGALAQDTPALYSLMNYADMELGTWYPQGGMYKVVEAFVSIAKAQGVKFELNTTVTEVKVKDKKINQVVTDKGTYEVDAVIGAADYHHIEQSILPQQYRMYSEKYWQNRKLAPSCLLYYLGVDKKIDTLLHHTLFFDADFELHGREIYKTKTWPQNPLFYLSAASRTDNSIAPPGHENLFLLIPVAPGLTGDTSELREKYFQVVMERLEREAKTPIIQHIRYRKDFGVTDFINDYNAFKGNAYGLSNTLDQTAILKPRMRSTKLNNLFFAGQITVPGPGVPPAIISGKVAANELIKALG